MTVLERLRDVRSLDELDAAELKRYSRHVILPEVGPEGQRRLKASKVLVVGAGGLGSPLSLYLAAAGVGTIGLVDFDRVDTSNLQRQILYGDSDVGRPKLDAAVERLRDVNPHVDYRPYETRLDSSNALEILEPYDVVIDGTDNFPTRYLVNDACVLLGKPNVYGSIFRFEGQVSVFWGAEGPCYRCLFTEPPPPGLVPSCAEGGVFGVLPGIVGSLQANEAIKLLAGIGDPLIGRLVIFDSLGLAFRELRLKKNPECPVCSDNPTQTGLIDYEEFCGVTEEAEPMVSADGINVTVADLKRRLDSGERIALVDVRTPVEDRIGRIDGATLIPVQELMARLGELDPRVETVVYCHHGPRSLQAVTYLRSQGFASVYNLRGGIDAWSLEIDPSVPRY